MFIIFYPYFTSHKQYKQKLFTNFLLNFKKIILKIVDDKQ